MLHNATVIGVEIPDGKVVPSGTVVDSQEVVKRLENVNEELERFKEEVVKVNVELARGYRRL